MDVRTRACGIRSILPVVAVLAASCASQTGGREPTTEGNACSRLQAVISEADAHFENIKRQRVPHRLGDRWEARGIFPDTTCEVWKWGGNEHYYCLWNETGEVAARQSFEEGKKAVRACLTNEWTLTEKQAKTGRVAVFSRENEDTRVALRYLADTRRYRPTWYTSLIVGNALRDPGELYHPAP
ncbi:hypothetical protein sS8_2010 [Methylocaldum marinum]|uniref:Lipoprotein n=1 Tax=Methylocaldum marinum TaxID=1432792 RepID=A0A250KQY4_9GAMM|nr:hypothetical protein [Methylocaldum marinum]BBA33964.1 hypothetical protein sS8_2010 [Methylocaldum marinum]